MRELPSNVLLEKTQMMFNWNDYRKQLAAGVKEIGQLNPDTIKGDMS
jgi:hypothetical protein